MEPRREWQEGVIVFHRHLGVCRVVRYKDGNLTLRDGRGQCVAPECNWSEGIVGLVHKTRKEYKQFIERRRVRKNIFNVAVVNYN